MRNRKLDNKGVAIIIVIGVLAILAMMVTSFAFIMRLEAKAAKNFQLGVKAKYAAEAGVAQARAILKQDKQRNNFDINTDEWRTFFNGDEIDNDGDGARDSRWFYLEGDKNNGIRYAVLVVDENSKININVAGHYNILSPQGWTPFEISLEKFLEANGISQAKDIADSILVYRYGEDKKPGKAFTDDDGDNPILNYDGIDNNADGGVDEPDEGKDEPDEFDFQNPCFDDRAFLSIEQIKEVEGVKNKITIYSQDKNITAQRTNRLDINIASAEELRTLLKKYPSIYDPAQKAANIADAIDKNHCLSQIDSIYGLEGVNFNEVYSYLIYPLAEPPVYLYFVELYNISEKDIDLRDWEIEWGKEIPSGRKKISDSDRVIKSKGYFIITNSEDLFRSCFGISKEIPVVEVEYLKLEKNGYLKLKDEYEKLAAIGEEYGDLPDGISKERVNIGGNSWQNSEDDNNATPGEKNSVYSLQGEYEPFIKDNPLANIGEICKVYYKNGERICVEDLSKIADELTTFSCRLEAENAENADEINAEEWTKENRIPFDTDWYEAKTEEEEIEEIWEWKGLKNGNYSLSVYGGREERVEVAVYEDDKWTELHEGIKWGAVKIENNSLKIKLKVLAGQTAHFDYIVLSPCPYTAGRININTASQEVLQALPGIDADLAEKIISNRPYAKIGELLFKEEKEILREEFLPISNLITTKSDIYKIISTAQVIREGEVMAEKKLEVVVER